MSQVDNNKRFVGRIISEYNRYLIERGVDPADLMNFTSDGITIIDPFEAAHEAAFVDPEVEYGVDYIGSDFVRSDFVERMAKNLELIKDFS